jgi:hypothetical protein
MVKNSDQSCVSFQTGKDNSPLQFFFKSTHSRQVELRHPIWLFATSATRCIENKKGGTHSANSKNLNVRLPSHILTIWRWIFLFHIFGRELSYTIKEIPPHSHYVFLQHMQKVFKWPSLFISKLTK